MSHRDKTNTWTWRHKRLKKACKVGLTVLNGVGENHTAAMLTNPPGLAVHVQKPLTEAERAAIPQWWHDIPARDELGPMLTVKL